MLMVAMSHSWVGHCEVNSLNETKIQNSLVFPVMNIVSETKKSPMVTTTVTKTRVTTRTSRIH